MKKAVILLSGGLDSATVAAIARQNFELHSLSFSYGQKHKIELNFASKLAQFFKVKEHKVININLDDLGGSALTDKKIAIPKNRKNLNQHNDIPVTYVPARNTIFLSFALSYAEVIGAFDIFIGVNALDYSGYPDCRPEFISAFEKMANLATTPQNQPYKINTPLLNLTKKEIIKIGLELGLDYALTHSCYDPILDNQPEETKIYACGKCDSCLIRIKGFLQNDMSDPYPYFIIS